MRRDPDPNRGTGRTQRMLEAVVAELRRGARSVVVFAHSHTYAGDLMRRLAEMLDPYGLTIETDLRRRELAVGRALVRFDSIKFEEHAVRGLDPKCFYDHHALDERYRR